MLFSFEDLSCLHSFPFLSFPSFSVAPPEVSFLLKGSDDPCAGRDILFELTGFRLQGQVGGGVNEDILVFNISISFLYQFLKMLMNICSYITM